MPVARVAAEAVAADAVAGVGTPAPGGAHHASTAGGAHHVTALAAIRLTAAQQVLYRLSAAAAPAPAARYVQLTEVQREPAAIYPTDGKAFASTMLKKRLPPKRRSIHPAAAHAEHGVG